MNRSIKENEIYRHFKGNYYIIIGIAVDSETEREAVVYKALYYDKKLFVRPLEMFLEKLDKNKYPNVKQKYRFEKVDLKEMQWKK